MKTFIKKNLRLAIATAVLVSACTVGIWSYASYREWDEHSNPDLFGAGFDTHFRKDILSAHLENKAAVWSDTYWPRYQGGIAKRWYDTGSLSSDDERDSWKYEFKTREQVAAMSLDELKRLSPAEKFDIVRGDYNYTLTKRVRDENSRLNPKWMGLCHGWSPAALYHTEPAPNTVANPEGIMIPFGSSDVKALLTYHYAIDQFNSYGYEYLGRRCPSNASRAFNDPRCRGPNPGAFHIILTNFFGLRKEGFVGDVDSGGQVWNQPITGFTTQILEERAPSSHANELAVKEVLVRTKLYYAKENGPFWNPVVGTNLQKEAYREYEYSIELDANDNIVGGEWPKKGEHPDFFWKFKSRPELKGWMAPTIQKVYKPAF